MRLFARRLDPAERGRDDLDVVASVSRALPDVAPGDARAHPTVSSDTAAKAFFDALYHQEFAWVFRTLRRLGARSDDLEDLTHDVFVAVFRALPRFDRARPVRPWLFGIAFRIVSDYRGRARFRREQASDTLDDHAMLVPSSPESELADAQARALLLRALDTLPFDQRVVYVASELDETPMPLLAEHLGLSVNTLYSRLRLARTRMQTAIEDLVKGGISR